jgi:hypothetical protein
MMCAVLLGTAGAVSAEGVMPTVEEQLAAMRKSMQRQQEEISALKVQLGTATGDREAIEAQREMIANMIRSETAKLTEGWGWVSNWTLKGDFRYRHEWVNDGDNANTRDDRNLHRIRLRLFLIGRVNDEITVTTGLATGSRDPVSTNQTLGDPNDESFFQTKDIWLDQAYLTWRPKACSGLAVFAGKMPNPFYKVNDMVYDGDLTFEGIAFNYERPLCEKVTLYVNGGGFWLDEHDGWAAAQGTTADTSLWGVQGYAKVDLKELAEKAYLLAGCAYYDYANIEGFPPIGIAAAGNAQVGGVYAMDYNIVNPFVEVGFNAFGLPMKVFGDIAVNTSSESVANRASKDDFGWMVGFQIGKAKDPGTWEIKYDYRDVQAESVFGAFADSDSWGGGSDGSGHRVGLGYALAKNTVLAATFFCDREDRYNGDENFYHRLQVDLVVKF